MTEQPRERWPESGGTGQPSFPPPAASTGAGFAGHQHHAAPGVQANPAQPPWPGQVVQPPPPRPAATPAPNWPLTIASLVPIVGFGCGIVALVLTYRVQEKLASGDFAGAQIAANSARTWAIVGVVINVLFVLGLASQMAY